MGIKTLALQRNKQITRLGRAAVGVHALDGQTRIAMQRCTVGPLCDLLQAEVHVRHARSPAGHVRPMPRVHAAHR